MDAVAIYKLIILFLLDRAGGELAMPRISSFLIENGYVNFESLLQTYAEIESNGFVEERKTGGTTFLSITQEGEETLGFFADQLSDDIKQEIRTYLKEMGREIANESAIVGDYYRSTFGDYTVHLSVRERTTTSGAMQPILTIDLAVPDEAAAKKAVSGWKDNSTDIYQALLRKLL